MNPVFICLVIFATIALWFLLSFIYKPLGKFLFRVWKEAVDEIKDDDDKKEKEKENK